MSQLTNDLKPLPLFLGLKPKQMQAVIRAWTVRSKPEVTKFSQVQAHLKEALEKRWSV